MKLECREIVLRALQGHIPDYLILKEGNRYRHYYIWKARVRVSPHNTIVEFQATLRENAGGTKLTKRVRPNITGEGCGD